MKKILHCLLVIVVCSFVTTAQPNSTFDPDKYRINLPDYWKPGNKIWQILDEKLPEVAEELKNKQLCGDHCKPKYTIEFEMSEPQVLDYYSNHISSGNTTETWEFVTLYAFSASLYLFDEKDKVLTKFILVDTNEIWRVIHQAQLPSFSSKPPMRVYALRPPFSSLGASSMDALRMQESYTNSVGRGISPYGYINTHKEELHPTQRDMFNVVDSKIKSW